MRKSMKKENLVELTAQVRDVKNRDVNCYLLRFTSLYMDGSYSGEDVYQLNIRKYNRCKNDETRLKLCYSMLTHMCKIEFGSFVTQTLLEKIMVGELDASDIEWFNQELLERAYSTLSHDIML